MRDKVITRVHDLVEGHAESPPVKAAEEQPEIMNATTEVKYHTLKLIQDLHQQFSTLATNNNRTNPPNPINTRYPSNTFNPRNIRRRNTRKYFGCMEIAHIPVWIAK